MERSALATQDMTLAGLNLIKQALSIYDKDLRLVAGNRQFQRMFGLPDHLVTQGADFGETIRYLVELGEYGAIADVDTFVRERIVQAKAFEPHYLERTRANGTTISIEGSPLRQGGWVAVYTDITDIKMQEALLRNRSADLSEELLSRSEELSKANRALTATVTALEEVKRDLTASQDSLNLINAMTPAHIARLDRAGVYTYSNRKLDSVVPGRSNDVLGRHFADALGTDIFASIGPAFARTLAGEAPVLEFEDKESGRHIRVAFTPDTATDGSVQGAYVLSMNVTDEVDARRALAHARRRELAAQLTSGLAHDFSNLLTIILGQNERLEQHPELSPELAKIAATIKSAAKRGGALLDGLSQIDAKRVLNVTATNMEKFVEGVKQLGQAAVPDNITLLVDVQTADSHLMFDSGFAQDALLNLVLNAVEAIEGQGEIKVAITAAKGPFLQFTVTDTGPGFTDHALENALAPFFTSKKGKPGRGLGLPTVFDFAKTSGGTLRLQNRPAGGAEVTLRIPYVAADPIAPGMVLLLEDTIEIRETVRGYLRRMGHAVIEADQVDEAIRLAEIPEITHIVTDLMLGDGQTGFALAKAVRQSGNQVPILFITGINAADEIYQDVAAEFPILQKPFGYDALAAAFRKGI